MDIQWHIQRGVQSILKGAIVVGALAAIVAIQRPYLQQMTASAVASDEAQRQEKSRLAVLSRLPSVGFGNVLADWTFLNLIQYDGDSETRQAVGYELAPQYFETITRFDPRFVDTYIFLSGILSHQMGRPEEAIALMDRGTTALTPDADPRAFLVWRIKGSDQLVLLNNVAESARSYDTAGDWALKSRDESVRPTGPILKQTAAFLRTDPNKQTLLLWSWSAIYDQAVMTRDRKTQDKARAKLTQIGAIERKDDRGNSYFILPPKSPAKSPGGSPSASPRP